MSTEVELTKAFQKVGEKYGYSNVKAEFANFTQLKCQWTRSYRLAEFKVSDYLVDADVKVYEDLADTLFSRIGGSDKPYAESMRECILNPEFAPKHRPTYIKRSRKLTTTGMGTVHNLDDSLDRLAEAGLIDKGKDVQVVWSTDGKTRKVASCSVVMKVIAISQLLDSEDIGQDIVDYAVYTQYLRIVVGAKAFGITNEINTREDERKYPNYREIEGKLDGMCLYI